MRFIGSKVLLVNHIEKIINENITNAKTFCDIFSGTTVVSKYFKKYFKIISNDILHFSYVLQKATITNNQIPEFINFKKKFNQNPFVFFEKSIIKPDKFKLIPFIYENYSPTLKSNRKYFTNENALKIDFIRQNIEEWKNEGIICENEYFYLLAGLIEAVPFISNIAGTYGAFLKHWDNRALKNLELIQLNVEDNKKTNESYNIDSNELIKSISGDILYIDPPYNTRQYAPNYHVLETISVYDNPKINGITGIRPYKDKRSNYCIKNNVINAFDKLIKNANFSNIIVSYSTEGIMNEDNIRSILLNYGNSQSFKVYRFPYRRYKHIPGKIEHNLEELIFYIKKGGKCN